jgi:hypothetical protein
VHYILVLECTTVHVLLVCVLVYTSRQSCTPTVVGGIYNTDRKRTQTNIPYEYKYYHTIVSVRGGARGSFWSLFGVVLGGILEYSGVIYGILGKAALLGVFLGSILEYFRVFWGKLAPPLVCVVLLFCTRFTYFVIHRK